MSSLAQTRIADAIARKQRQIARKAEKSFDMSHPYDAVGKAVTMAEAQGALEALQDLLDEFERDGV